MSIIMPFSNTLSGRVYLAAQFLRFSNLTPVYLSGVNLPAETPLRQKESIERHAPKLNAKNRKQIPAARIPFGLSGSLLSVIVLVLARDTL